MSRSVRPKKTITISDDEAGRKITDVLTRNRVILVRGEEGLLGTGTYSIVNRASFGGQDVAVKIIDKRVGGEYIKHFLQRELAIIVRLKHPNIISVHTVHQTREFVAIVEEFAEGGDMLNYIRRKPSRYLNENEARFFFRQLIEAIIYLERNHIVHRDIKCENVFLDRNNNIKLGDFGFSRELRPGEHSNTHCGSRPYAAIELLMGKTYTGNAVDIWSSGIFLHIMLTGMFPFGSGKDNIDAMIKRQKYQAIDFPSRLSDSVKALILHMLHPVEALRATSSTILAHSWLQARD